MTRAIVSITLCLIFFGELMEQRKDDGRILRFLALAEAAGAAPGSCRICAFAVRVHHPAAGGDPRVEHPLHERPLIDPGADADGVALPVASTPLRLAGDDDAINGLQPCLIPRRKLAPPGDDRRQALQLLASDGRLDVCHPVVVAGNHIFLEHHLRG
jgi:hypothetical protein